MILLLQTKMPVPYRQQSEYVRPVSYNGLDKIPQLLLSTAPSTWKTGTTPPYQRRPRAAATTGAKPNDDYNRRGRRSFGIPRRAAYRRRREAIMFDEDEGEEIDETLANAAKAIQGAYRRHLKRKNVARSGIDMTQAHYWQLLHKRSIEMGWSKDSRYYLLFRVPLAYILVSLDVVKEFVESEKKEAKKRMMAEGDQDLEELMEALDQRRCVGVDYTFNRGSNILSSKLLEKTIALQEKLVPSSEFHEGQSVSDLQHAVYETKAVVESLDSIPGWIETKNQIQERWDRGWKWILEKQGSRAKGKKDEKLKLVLNREALPYL